MPLHGPRYEHVHSSLSRLMGGTDSRSHGDWEASFSKSSTEATVGPLGEDKEGEPGAPGESQAPERRSKGALRGSSKGRKEDGGENR